MTVARAFADSLVDRPMFCDLLAQAPLNLERNVSIESVRAFKLVTLDEVSAISAELHRVLGLTEQQGVDVIATATSLAGALWQMATPGPEVARALPQRSPPGARRRRGRPAADPRADRAAGGAFRRARACQVMKLALRAALRAQPRG